jgi:hypothetical protein
MLLRKIWSNLKITLDNLYGWGTRNEKSMHLSQLILYQMEKDFLVSQFTPLANGYPS